MSSVEPSTNPHQKRRLVPMRLIVTACGVPSFLPVMRLLTATRVGLFLISGLAVVSAASAALATDVTRSRPLSAAESAQGFRNGRVLVVERTGPSAANIGPSRRSLRETAERRVGVRQRRTFNQLPGIAVLHFDESQPVGDVIAELEATGLYESVEIDRAVRPLATPNDPAFTNGSLWGLHNTGQSNGTNDADIDAPEGWDIRREAPNVIVAVIDSGIRLNHQDLKGNLWINPNEIAGDGKDNDGNGYIDDVHGINAITNSGVPADDRGHGSHVAGTIGAVGNNGIGSTGIAWRVKMMALKFLPAEGEGSTADEIECINYAIANGAHIINASFGSDVSLNAELAAIRRARDAGIIFVAAAGNDGLDNDVSRSYPANYALENIVSVAASTRTDTLAYFSNFGSGAVDLAAPGEAIYSTTSDSDSAYDLNQGTSMAAPHVSGVLALLRAEYPAESYRQLINRLLRGVERVPGLDGRVQTSGRLNLARALSTTSNRPFNDDFASRASIAGANVRVRNDNTGATSEATEPAHANNTGSTTLWWEWTAPMSSRVFVDTLDSAYDTVLAVYTGSTLGSLTEVASNDNIPEGTASRVTLNTTAGTRYQIAVAGKSGLSGLTIVNIGSVPENDDFADATEVTGASVKVDGTTRNASKEAGETNHGGPGSRSVWYRWTAPASGTYQAAAFATEINTLLAVYRGASLASLTQLDANDNPVSGNSDALVTFEATAGTTYHFAVDDNTFGEPGAPFTLTITPSVWQAPATDEINGSPAVGPDGTVYFGSIDGYLYAIRASDGARKWRYDAGDEIRDSAPAVASNGTIYVGSVDGILHAVNSDGSRRWTYQAGSTPLGSTPALGADGTIYFRDDDTLHAVTPSGARKWTRSIGSGTYSSPVVARDGTVYIGSAIGQFRAIDPANGTPKWMFNANGDIFSSPAIANDGTILIATLNGWLYAIDPTTGSARWSLRLGTGESLSSSPVLGVDGTIYIASYDRRLYAVAGTGTVRWSYLMADEVRASSPAVDANGTVYIGNYDGDVYAVSSNGQLVATYPTARGIRSSMTLANGRLYFGSADGKVYAIPAAAPASSPWPQFQHAANHDGRAADVPAPSKDLDPRAVNLSTRAAVGSGDETLIGGFVIDGGPRSILVRAVGPTLAGFGVVNPLANPHLQLFREGTPIKDNDDWGNSPTLATTAEAVGAFELPADSKDAALRIDLEPGHYTAHVTSVDGGTGEAIVEFYEVGATGAGRFVNLSTRAAVQPGTPAIAGFVIGSGPRTVLLRVVGPGLTELDDPVLTAASDPKLTLLDADGAEIVSNDNWSATPELLAASVQAGAFALPDASNDAVLLVHDLAPGKYTVHGSVASGDGGVVLVEIYMLP